MSLPALPAEAHRILLLTRDDRAAARAAVAALPLERQVALVCETPMARRGELLDLAPSPELLIPALPEAELCFTVKAIGLADAGWVLEHATTEQIVACVDLDGWEDQTPDLSRVGEWLGAVAEAGEEALVPATHAIDPELLVLWLMDRIEVFLKPPDSEDDGWQPPAGGLTLDGQFYFRARKEDDDLGDIRSLLDALFRNDYWRYFRMLQGTVWELRAESEEWALRWRAGRLLDLGFPPFEEAMAIYGVLPARQLDELPPEGAFAPIGEWPLPVWMPRLPVTSAAEHSVFRALAALPEQERRSHLYAFLALANRVAVAERMPLGDAETIPRALERAAERVSAGLDHLVAARAVDPTEVLRRASLERLFRVGSTLSGDAPFAAPG